MEGYNKGRGTTMGMIHQREGYNKVRGTTTKEGVEQRQTKPREGYIKEKAGELGWLAGLLAGWQAVAG